MPPFSGTWSDLPAAPNHPLGHLPGDAGARLKVLILGIPWLAMVVVGEYQLSGGLGVAQGIGGGRVEGVDRTVVALGGSCLHVQRNPRLMVSFALTGFVLDVEPGELVLHRGLRVGVGVSACRISQQEAGQVVARRRIGRLRIALCPCGREAEISVPLAGAHDARSDLPQACPELDQVAAPFRDTSATTE